MKKISTLLIVVFATLFTISASAQTKAVTAADLAGHWKFAGKATSKMHEVQNNSGFEYTFNNNNTVTYINGDVRPFVIKGNNIHITDIAGQVAIVHIESFGKDEMTVITDYNTLQASTEIVFKRVK